jgi:uncharacterized cupredoxin-like copper-binding protein
MRRISSPVVVAMALLLLSAAGCGDDDDDGGAEVDVVLSEFIVDPAAESVEAGEVTSADDLPVDDDDAFDEEAFGEDNVLGEVEDIEAGDTGELTLDLEAGDYVLLCNIVEEEEDGEVESHFSEGMHTTFTVE